MPGVEHRNRRSLAQVSNLRMQADRRRMQADRRRSLALGERQNLGVRRTLGPVGRVFRLRTNGDLGQA